MSNYSLMSVSAAFLRAGETVHEDSFKTFLLPLEDSAEVLPERSPNPAEVLEFPNTHRLLVDNVGFDFGFMGDWTFCPYCSGAEEDFAEGGEHLVRQHLPGLAEMARVALADAEKAWASRGYRDRDRPRPTEVTFITVWRYSAGFDYDGEFESETTLVGVVSLDEIGKLACETAGASR